MDIQTIYRKGADMSSDAKQTLKTIVHPYLFVLKEGTQIKQDLLDYSLVMLLINSSETIKSPEVASKQAANLISKVEIRLQAPPTILG